MYGSGMQLSKSETEDAVEEWFCDEDCRVNAGRGRKKRCCLLHCGKCVGAREEDKTGGGADQSGITRLGAYVTGREGWVPLDLTLPDLNADEASDATSDCCILYAVPSLVVAAIVMRALRQSPLTWGSYSISIVDFRNNLCTTWLRLCAAEEQTSNRVNMIELDCGKYQYLISVHPQSFSSPIVLLLASCQKCLKLVTFSPAISGFSLFWSPLSMGRQAANLDKQALKRGHLARWANDLQDLADAIPDTHGLMIHRIWKGLPPPIRRQIPPNHASWETFCNALRNLVPGVETIPDTTVIPEPEPEAEPEVEISVPLSSEMHGDGTDLSRYFWPRYALPVLSNGCQSAADALTSAGMRLVGLVYDARKTIVDLGSVFVEFEPLLHTSPQIYTRKQWDGGLQQAGSTQSTTLSRNHPPEPSSSPSSGSSSECSAPSSSISRSSSVKAFLDGH
ncbi:hypothetical protein B0H10DRAFT_1965517 [Mycena sp. CBHHK59/15]|nr:hypothetical protein B0H10DRAFT_1965517 [Mycena sp. CBHHK59/15]